MTKTIRIIFKYKHAANSENIPVETFSFVNGILSYVTTNKVRVNIKFNELEWFHIGTIDYEIL